MKYIVVIILMFFSLSVAKAEIYTSLAKALKNPLKVDSLDLSDQKLTKEQEGVWAKGIQLNNLPYKKLRNKRIMNYIISI